MLHIPTRCKVVAGQPDARNAAYVIEMLDRACDGCTNGEFAAMVTAPVQKSTLMDAGYRLQRPHRISGASEPARRCR